MRTGNMHHLLLRGMGWRIKHPCIQFLCPFLFKKRTPLLGLLEELAHFLSTLYIESICDGE